MREITIVGVFVMALFFAGGVYSQFAQGNEVQESISRGLAYLESQPQYDSELLVMHMIQAKGNHPEVGAAISSKSSKTDDFHYPIKQFVSNVPIEMASVSKETLQAPYYSDFIHYFKCEPLTQEWINSLSNLSDTEDEPYNGAHALWILSLIRQDYLGGRCGDHSAFAEPLNSMIDAKAIELESSLDDKKNFDAWVERVAVLGFVGSAVSQENIEYILSMQAENGGWAPQTFEGETLDEERSHTTALAVWALVEASS